MTRVLYARARVYVYVHTYTLHYAGVQKDMAKIIINFAKLVIFHKKI